MTSVEYFQYPSAPSIRSLVGSATFLVPAKGSVNQAHGIPGRGTISNTVPVKQINSGGYSNAKVVGWVTKNKPFPRTSISNTPAGRIPKNGNYLRVVGKGATEDGQSFQDPKLFFGANYYDPKTGERGTDISNDIMDPYYMEWEQYKQMPQFQRNGEDNPWLARRRASEFSETSTQGMAVDDPASPIDDDINRMADENDAGDQLEEFGDMALVPTGRSGVPSYRPPPRAIGGLSLPPTI